MNETPLAFQSARIVEWSTLENEADFSALPNKNEKRHQCKWLQTSQRKVPRRNHAEKRHQQQSTINETQRRSTSTTRIERELRCKSTQSNQVHDVSRIQTHANQADTILPSLIET